MNDRFKFRCWNETNNCWQKRFLIHNYMEQSELKIFKQSDWVQDEKQSGYKLTLEQCTGLKDKNGKLIYEGDLIKEPANSHNLKVIWENGAWQTEEYRKNGNREQLLYCLVNCYGVEIVGNIHEVKEEE